MRFCILASANCKHSAYEAGGTRLRGSLFLGSRFPVHTSCECDTPFPDGEFRRLRAAGERRSRAGPKRVDNLRFSTLLGSSPFPFGSLANEPYGSTS